MTTNNKERLQAAEPGKVVQRLDVPGFSLGTKTGEFIDVPRIFGGKPQPKRSSRPHSLSELLDSSPVSRARKAIRLAAQIAKEDYFKRKRTRSRELKRAIKPPRLVGCNRRFFEHLGMSARHARAIPYGEEPELFISKAKTAYEVTDGFCPIVTTTSAREALLICASLARHGLAAYFNKVTVPRL